ncbi:MAG: hypothetical protein ABIS29_13530 [Vicinamibacterales bacterium]
MKILAMSAWKRLAAACCAVLLLCHSTAVAQTPTPVEPVAAILAAFKSHSLVAMSDAHGNEQNHAFRLSLIRDPRFPAVVNDIVLELGNAFYQDLADRYVGGDEVPYSQLRQIWENTVVQTGGNNYLMIEELLRVVRDVNSKLPRDRQMRVLLGDPPIDWNRVRTKEDWSPFFELRESYPAALIQIEVIAKQRRALVLYGHLHFQRKNIFSNFAMDYWQAQTLVNLIETATPTKVFTIWQLDLEKAPVDATKWPVPSLVTIRGTELGRTDVAVFRTPPGRFTIQGGKMIPVPKDQWRSLQAEEQFDAILYLGPASTMKNRQSHEIPPALCAEPGYLTRQLQRMALSAPPPEIERLKQYCANVSTR